MAYLRQQRYRRGKGFIGRFINRAIDGLPFELHIPGGYQFCGPGTRLTERLARGDVGINALDRACRTHDIAYHEHKGSEERKKADEELAKRAWERAVSSDASLGERAAALGVSGVMKLKSKLGGGVKEGRVNKKRKRNRFIEAHGGGDRMEREKQRRCEEINVIQQGAKAKESVQSKARRFQQTETVRRLHREQPPFVLSPLLSPSHPHIPEQRLKIEVEKTRSNIRNKLKALREFESSRDDVLKTYLTTPVKKAFEEGTKSNNRFPAPSGKAANEDVVDQIKSPPSSPTSSSSAINPHVLKNKIKTDEDEVSYLDEPHESEDSSSRSIDHSWGQYIHALAQSENADVDSGPHFRSHSSTGERTLYIGHSKMTIHENGNFTVGKVTYEPQMGLLELLFRKRPNLEIVEERDWNNYKRILQHTNAHKEGYHINGAVIANNAWKYNNVFAALFPPSHTADRALRVNTLNQRKATPIHQKKKKKSGKGLRFVTPPDYKYWRDPNKLVRRLRLLLASQKAGNNSHEGEIIEIENELRDAGIIL